MLFIFPSDPLNPKKVDPHYAEEKTAAMLLGHQTMLIDHDALTAGDPSSIKKIPSNSTCLYRGWMLSVEDYAKMEETLFAKNSELFTTSKQYKNAHQLPSWYEMLKGFTPTTHWSTTSTQRDFYTLLEKMQEVGATSVVLRDYVKSAKHYWNEACFVPNIQDKETAWKIAQKLKEIRDEDFAGGFVARSFENFLGAETRTWWKNGTCILQSAHPDTPQENHQAVPTELFEKAIANLHLAFITVDFMKRADGKWRIIEIGDGGVSDKPSSTNAESLIEALSF